MMRMNIKKKFHFSNSRPVRNFAKDFFDSLADEDLQELKQLEDTDQENADSYVTEMFKNYKTTSDENFKKASVKIVKKEEIVNLYHKMKYHNSVR